MSSTFFGHIKLYNRLFRKSLKLTDWKFTKTRLNDMELDQEVKFFDGKYDEEYLAIRIPVPFQNISINLSLIKALLKSLVILTLSKFNWILGYW